MLTKKLAKVLLLITVFTVALYGCSGNKEDTNKSKTPANEDSSITEPTETAQSEPTYGGSITVGITQDLDGLDPHKALSAGTKEVLFNIFEGLVKLDKDGNLVPAVAESYHISEDGMTYTFTLREGVKFHDGSPVTADDVVYSIKRSAGMLEPKDPSVIVESALSVISDVVATSERTIEIRLKQVETELLPYLTCSIVPKDYEELDTKPIGTGPFKFVSYTPLQSIVLEKNDQYYIEGVPYLDKVTFKISSNTDAAFMELQAGNIDILPYITDAQASQLPKGYHMESGPMNLIQGLFINNKVAPFDNKLVRQALCYAVDRQAVIDMVAGGRGNVIGTNMYPGFKKYYDESLVNTYPYDPKKAKELLKEAGYPKGFKFTIMVPSNYQYHIDTAQVIVEQLKQVGITAQIQLIEWSGWKSDVYKGRKYETTLVGLAAELAPRKALARFRSDAENNFMNYTNPEFDALYKQGEAETVEEKKIQLYKQMEAMLTNDAVAVYIQDPHQMTAVSDKLGGYTYYPIYVQDMSLVYYKK
ncbi:ABC transporter substrate-binding protein [Clostridium thermosuccinogenes]|uniref:ABC transporter substrate-binding protein n=1 Tax=Clostridium thermosuccinogenes TaxID=84032 RepID=UPI000CCC1F78|nr:ABC transporter substrate-binding protein [Pseudoclostridium thermosuccinogenes]PNT90643.1 ABC transporter substrate-binding protein [Pseudoclostridium thermosuccinogenes]